MATGPLIEEVATNLEEAAAVTRSLNAQGIGFFVAGVAVGVGIGFYFGYRWNREKIRAEVLAEAEQTISEIREVYREKPLPAIKEKPALDDVVKEKRYSTEPERPLPAPVPVYEPERPQDHPDNKEKDEGWDYRQELSQRGPDRPYIIHQDEYQNQESGYSQVTLTYYDGDDVLTEENDTVIENVEGVIGVSNLIHWGHGSDDINVVYIRNPKIEVEYEVCRSPKSYAEEIQGLEHSDSPGFERMPRRHAGFDDDNKE